MSKSNASASDIKLRKLTIFSSGVGFFEHDGEITGDAEVALPFNKDALNDALKSIVISDPDASPAVTYHSEETLLRTLKGLSIDLYEVNHIADLLNSLKGAEIELFAPNSQKGRILFVETRRTDGAARPPGMPGQEQYLTLLTAEGIRAIRMQDVGGFSFSDPKINEDANRALDLIMKERDSDVRNLTIKLPGKQTRKVSFSYVIPAPVWKVSYRLDLSRDEPFLQGWAIVDNDSDTDWDAVELSLVTGKPVSFTQDLYAPYRLARPAVPLAIAGVAAANVYDSGTAAGRDRAREDFMRASDTDDSPVSPVPPRPIRNASMSGAPAALNARTAADGAHAGGSTAPTMQGARAASGIAGSMGVPAAADIQAAAEAAGSFSIPAGQLETALGREAGDQFEFTVKTPVDLQRQQSAMLPLVEGSVNAKKTLVFTAARPPRRGAANPAIAAELVNSTGMKLPAGAITVYDDGTYAGDALIEFFPEDEKRIIAYGEDLSVTGRYADSNRYRFNAVSVGGGVMAIEDIQIEERAYTFRNASGKTRRLIVEHPYRPAAKLTSPSEYLEKTGSHYRFEIDLPSGETAFSVREEKPSVKQIVMSDMPIGEFVRFSTDDEFPAPVRAALNDAAELKRKADSEQEKLNALQTQLNRLLEEQERIRKNLESAGPQTQQGQNYLARLTALDNDIDAAQRGITAAEQAKKDAREAFIRFVRNIRLT